MRRLAVYMLIGALFGAWIGLLLTAVAIPAYDEYLMPLSLYEGLPFTGSANQWITVLEPWLQWIGLALYIGLWFMIAGTLNPSLARFPFAPAGRPFWAWIAWTVAGTLFLGATLLALTMSDVSVLTSGDGNNLLKWTVMLTLAAASWLLISPQAFGRYGGGSPAFAWGNAARAAGLGVLFMLSLVVVGHLAGTAGMAWLTYIVEALDHSSEVSTFGLAGATIAMVVVFTLAGGLVFGLLPLFVPGAGDRQTRLASVRPMLKLSAVVAVLALASVMIFAKADYFNSTGLAGLTGLDKLAPQTLRLVKLCGGSECRVSDVKGGNAPLAAALVEAQVQTSGIMIGGGGVPLHPDSATALEKFVTEAGRTSVLRKSALTGAYEVRRALWQFEDAMQLADRMAAGGHLPHGNLFWTQLQLTWLLNASPINDKARAMLAEMSDERRYHIGTRGAARLAAAWARFGDMEKSRDLLARVLKEAPEKYDYIRLARGDLATGRITGRVVLPGGAEGVRIGLFRMSKDPTSKPDPRKRADSKPAFGKFLALTRITHSQMLDASGRFDFSQLGAGDYYLALQVPDAKLGGKNRVTGINVPDLIVLSGARARRDLGEIRLTP